MSGLNLQTINKKTSLVFTLFLFIGFFLSGSIIVLLEYFNNKTMLLTSPSILQTAIDELFQQTIISIFLVLVTSLVISFIAFKWLNKYQKTFTKPITDLAAIANQFSTSKTYIIPEIPVCADEITTIYLAFANIVSNINDKKEELKLSESRLQEILDNSIFFITIKNLEGVITYTNKHLKDFLLQAKEKHYKDNTNTTIEDLLTKRDANIHVEKDQQVINTGKPVNYEAEITLADGLHFFHMVKIPLHDDEKEVYSICTIANEISEAKQHEEYLKRSQKMEALGKLTGGIAHDYNNMLAVIIGFAQLVESAATDSDKVIKFAREIKKAGNRGAKLTSRLLSFSRTKAAEPRNINISELIDADKHMLERTLTARIQLDLNLIEEIWSVCIDQDDLQDAILNLCINAMHAIESTGTLTIKTDNVKIESDEANILELTPGEHVLIQISDTGHGMDNDVLSHIFDPFFSTKGESGSGLGLSQVYGFVKRSHGASKVESTVGVGSHFYSYFPRTY